MLQQRRKADFPRGRIWVIFDRPDKSCLPVHVGFTPQSGPEAGRDGQKVR